ncbi:MAG: hypothetical protein H7A41_04990 [Chlamydiales bacterium]|nr:hypothetical protein [Chlamydiales bacterium]
MSNFISIITTAYNKNLIDEANDAWESVKVINEKWYEPAGEVDLAKIVGFVAKIFGTISLAFLALSTFTIIQKRSVSLTRLVYIASCFFGAAEFLKAGNNLHFEYTMTAREKAAKRKAENDGEWFSGLRAGIGHAWQKTKQTVRQPLEAFVIDDPAAIDEFRAMRVVKVAVQDTYILGPIYRAAVGA